ncbi:MAG TPA: class I SAM-dependent methyltransferase [Polyangiaceae bacterium]|jgi:SAM-dependent methyltransferase|nr:class I SAM-dependent methyltransferase [Polyangiaceae bacterium]
MTTFREAFEAIRHTEVVEAAKWLPNRTDVLELGGGDGFQARILSELGYRVESIDVAPREPQVFPVKRYDGDTIPFADATFDCVFSSNVLEHVVNLERTFSELRRVLKPGGIGVHLVPTPAWRFWTTVTHYPRLIRTVPSKLARGESPRPSPTPGPPSRTSRSAAVLRIFGLDPHGEHRTAVEELYYFSQVRWRRAFLANGFGIEQSSPGRLFYTGHLMLPNVSLAARRHLSTLLGSACRVFVTRRA